MEELFWKIFNANSEIEIKLIIDQEATLKKKRKLETLWRYSR